MISEYLHIHTDCLRLFYWLSKDAFCILFSETKIQLKSSFILAIQKSVLDTGKGLEVLLQGYSLYKLGRKT